MFYWLCHNCKPHHAQVVSGEDRSSTNHISRFVAEVKAREIKNSRQGEKATQENIYMYATEHQCQQPKRKKRKPLRFYEKLIKWYAFDLLV